MFPYKRAIFKMQLLDFQPIYFDFAPVSLKYCLLSTKILFWTLIERGKRERETQNVNVYVAHFQKRT